jgi:hypothetical protein
MLWGNKDYPAGNQKPVFANTSTTTSNSTTQGTTANSGIGIVAGVSPGEQTASAALPQHPTHSGWVALKIGRGPITNVRITGVGTGINADGFIVVTDGALTVAQGSGINISFTKANTQNVLQAHSTNYLWNGVATITIVNAGNAGWSNSSAITASVSNAANTSQPTFAFTLGGRAGRYSTETLVAMKSITLDDSKDNVFFSGV